MFLRLKIDDPGFGIWGAKTGCVGLTITTGSEGDGMSQFSALLSTYIERSGMTIVSLSKQSGFEATHITKFKNGSRRPVNQEKLERLIGALRLAPADQKQLYTLWQIEQMGEGVYRRHMAVRELLNSFHRRVEVKQDVMMWHNGTMEVPRAYTGRQNVEYVLRQVLTDAAENQKEPLRLIAQPGEPLDELLFLLCNRTKPVPIVHILSLFGSAVDDDQQIQNLLYLKSLLPCAIANAQYQMLFYYDQTLCSENHYALTPNLFLTQKEVVLVTRDWRHCVVHTDAESLKFYGARFEQQLRVSRQMGESMGSLQEELMYLLKNVQQVQNDAAALTTYNLADQPCLMPFVDERDAQYLKSASGGSDLASAFFQHYQPLLRRERPVQFFQLSGLADFLTCGIIWEVGENNIRAMPPAARLRIAKNLLTRTQSGEYQFYLIREEEMPIPKDTVVTMYPNDFLTLHTRNDKDRIYALSENGVTKVIRDFFEFLPQSWFVFSREESLQQVKRLLAEYEAVTDTAGEDVCEQESDAPQYGF